MKGKQSMNYRKGLKRIFILSSIFVFLGGFFTQADKEQSHWNEIEVGEKIWKANVIADFNKPTCQDKIKDSPLKFPDWSSEAPNPCHALSTIYDEVKAFHDQKNKVGQITEKDFKEYLQNRRGIVSGGIYYGTFTLVFYWVILLWAYLAFKVLQWVYEGFKER